jgi:hypothetical protein
MGNPTWDFLFISGKKVWDLPPKIDGICHGNPWIFFSYGNVGFTTEIGGNQHSHGFFSYHLWK